MTKLDDILRATEESLAKRRAKVSLEDIRGIVSSLPPTLSFRNALVSHNGEMRIIAEMKKSSPTGSFGGKELDAVPIAKSYEKAGAAALSVLTEEKYFAGAIEDLRSVKRHVRIPVLLKDFVVDPYQIYEARAAGADAVLLIATILNRGRLSEFNEICSGIGITPFIEVTDEKDMEKILNLNLDLMGINNRNLRDFKIDVNRIESILPLIPRNVLVVAESGISSTEDVKRLREMGVNAALVGTALMKEADPGTALRRLLDDS